MGEGRSGTGNRESNHLNAISDQISVLSPWLTALEGTGTLLEFSTLLLKVLNLRLFSLEKKAVRILLLNCILQLPGYFFYLHNPD